MTRASCEGDRRRVVERSGCERGGRPRAEFRLLAGDAGDPATLESRRGIDTLSALGLCAEVGNFERFKRPAQLMSCLGLVPSENSSGEKRRQGSITKSGSRHARRLLVMGGTAAD